MCLSLSCQSALLCNCCIYRFISALSISDTLYSIVKHQYSWHACILVVGPSIAAYDKLSRICPNFSKSMSGIMDSSVISFGLQCASAALCPICGVAEMLTLKFSIVNGGTFDQEHSHVGTRSEDPH